MKMKVGICNLEILTCLTLVTYIVNEQKILNEEGSTKV